MIRSIFIFIIVIKISYGFNHKDPFFYKIKNEKNNNIPISFIQSLSFGYEDNFMRFSDLEIDSYHNETYTDNDYLGDSKFYDSAIISPSFQATLKPKIKSYKTNIILKAKFNEYTSSNHKSYFNFSTRFELKLKSYNWIKFSYSLTPRYYLRTFIDRDILPLTYYPCYFANENVYLSYSFPLPIKSIRKTWVDIKLNLNNQFYNENFTEYDTKVINLEANIKTSSFKNHFFSIGYFYAIANNISYDNPSGLSESTKIDRSYNKIGLKINAKKTFNKPLISSLGIKLKVSKRVYDLDSWYYEFDNWKEYYESDLTINYSKKINKRTTVQVSGKHFFRDVIASQSKETLWVEDYKIYNRNELWLRFVFNFSNR